MQQIVQVFVVLALSVSMLNFFTYWIAFAATDNVNWPRSAFKTSATLIPAVLGLTTTDGGLQLMFFGLAFGALGDFALSRRGEPAFLAGMAAFATGHLLYAFALIQRSRQIVALDLEYDAGRAFAGNPIASAQILALIALAALILSTELWLAPRTGDMRWAVRGYVLVIGAMAAAAILIAPNTGHLAIRLGATLFVASDLLLALRLFVTKSPLWQTRAALTLWPAYWAGQMLILYGAILYWTGPKG